MVNEKLKIGFVVSDGNEFEGDVINFDALGPFNAKAAEAFNVPKIDGTYEVLVSGDFEVEVEDTSTYIGYVVVTNVQLMYIKNDKTTVIDLKKTEYDIDYLERRINHNFDWASYFANYEETKEDKCYENWLDSQDGK